MRSVSATLINLYHVCHRELWLHANEIRMEHTSDIVAEGKLIGETSYERRPDKFTQVDLDGVKIDFFDARTRTVHETKRGRAIEEAHRAQVQYYLYKLAQHGVEGACGIIEYPDLRKTEPVQPLTPADISAIQVWEADIRRIIQLAECPPVINKPFCRHCSFHDLCFISEP